MVKFIQWKTLEQMKKIKKKKHINKLRNLKYMYVGESESESESHSVVSDSL